MTTTKLNLLFMVLFLTLTLSHSRLTRPESSSSGSISDKLKEISKANNNDEKFNDRIKTKYPRFVFRPWIALAPAPASDFPFAPAPASDFPFPPEPLIGLGPPASDIPIPGGPGGSYNGLSGGYSKKGDVRPTVVCKEKGHCYMKKLTCPAKCLKSFSRSSTGYGDGGSGGGGGCTMDCKKCVAYC